MREINNLRKWVCFRKRLHIQYEAPVGDKVPEGDLYFETLEASWNVAHAVAQRKKSRSWM